MFIMVEMVTIMAVNVELQKSPSLEERLQPWIDQAEYLILLTIAFMAWAAGWVDLLGFQPSSPEATERFRLPHIALIVVYSLGFVALGWAMVSLRTLERLKRLVTALQARPLWTAVVWIGFGMVLWTMLARSIFGVEISRFWANFRLLQLAILVLMLVFSAAVLLTRPSAGTPMQRWRIVVLALIGVVLVAEVVVQLLGVVRALPVDNISGITVPYGRIYQQSEGFGNGVTNGYGYYYPEFRLEPDTRRIILTGDTFVEALQIPMDAHMGVQLDALVNTEATPSEVMAMGLIGYGPTTFMSWRYYTHTWYMVEPDELVIVFNLANDFYIESEAAQRLGRVAVDADGIAEVIPEDFERWHLLADLTVLGHNAPDPMRTVFSQSQLVNLLARDSLGDPLNLSLNPRRFPSNIEQATPEQPFGPASFLFRDEQSETAEQSYSITEAILHTLVRQLADYDLTIRLVTIPHFPAQFYADNSGDTWSPTLGEYDLLLPEQRLAQAAQANGVSFLGMTEYMRSLTPAQIRALYFADGTRHLTEAGHELLADAMYACFYADEPLAANVATACVP
jgi:hypothetical protein